MIDSKPRSLCLWPPGEKNNKEVRSVFASLLSLAASLCAPHQALSSWGGVAWGVECQVSFGGGVVAGWGRTSIGQNKLEEGPAIHPVGLGPQKGRACRATGRERRK